MGHPAQQAQCAANYGQDHSIAAAFGVQDTVLGNLIGGNIVSGIVNTGLAITGNSNPNAAPKVGLPTASTIGNSIIPSVGSMTAEIGINAVKGVGQETIELGITASGSVATSVASVGATTVSNIATGIGAARLIFDAATFAYGFYKCGQ